MPTTPESHRALHRRAGMSVVEVLIALMLVSIGLLGMAGSTALALRTAHDSAQRRHSTHRIMSRHSQLASAGCSSARSGVATDTAHALTEHWSVSVQPNGFALMTDSVRWMGARGPHSFVLTSAFQC